MALLAHSIKYNNFDINDQHLKQLNTIKRHGISSKDDKELLETLSNELAKSGGHRHDSNSNSSSGLVTSFLDDDNKKISSPSRVRLTNSRPNSQALGTRLRPVTRELIDSRGANREHVQTKPFRPDYRSENNLLKTVYPSGFLFKKDRKQQQLNSLVGANDAEIDDTSSNFLEDVISERYRSIDLLHLRGELRRNGIKGAQNQTNFPTTFNSSIFSIFGREQFFT